MTNKSISHKECSISGCSRTNKVKGVCSMHSQRFYRSGSYQLKRRKYVYASGTTPEERFWSKVDRVENGCWHWGGGYSTSGYGKCFWQGTVMYAHRAAWAIANKRLPQMPILHSCDNRKCCNPDHLREGTLAENAQDCKDRGRVTKGEAVASSKLLARDVREIRNLWARARQGEIYDKDIAALYGVHTTTIQRLRTGQTWRWVNDETQTKPPTTETSGQAQR